MNNISIIFKKHKDVIAYLFFGVCTTLVNVVAYWFCAHGLKLGTMQSTVLAWISAVLFAYVTNRKWVFNSEAKGRIEIMKEMLSFFGCRFATGVVDLLCMFVFVQLLGLNDVIIKFLSNIIVIVLNYVASKMIIFRKNKDK